MVAEQADLSVVVSQQMEAAVEVVKVSCQKKVEEGEHPDSLSSQVEAVGC